MRVTRSASSACAARPDGSGACARRPRASVRFTPVGAQTGTPWQRVVVTASNRAQPFADNQAAVPVMPQR